MIEKRNVNKLGPATLHEPIGMPLSATVLFRSQEVVSGTVCHATSHQPRLSLFSESASKHLCSHVHSLLNLIHLCTVSKFLNCRPL